MLLRISILAPLLLAACEQDPRSLRLSDIDMTDAALVDRIERQLAIADRAPFVTYALIHGRSGKYCGYVRGRDGKPPQTVGDAIEFMRGGPA